MASPILIRGHGVLLQDHLRTDVRDLFTVPVGKRLIIEYVNASAHLEDESRRMTLELALQDEGGGLERQALIPITFQGQLTWFIFVASQTVKLYLESGVTLATRFTRDHTLDKGFVSLSLWGLFDLDRATCG